MKMTVRQILNVLTLVAMTLVLVMAPAIPATADIDDVIGAEIDTKPNMTGDPRLDQTLANQNTAWTVIVYLNGDNSLDPSTDEAFNRMEVGACNPNVDVVVLWDRHPGGPWGPGTRRYKVKCDTNLDEPADYTEGVDTWDCGELNLGDDQMLFDFVNWAQTQYLADHYLLSIANHGGGWSPELPSPMRHRRGWMAGGTGLSWDETGMDPADPDDLDYLSTHEVGQVLQHLPHPLDVVFYDACLMGMLEEAYEIKEYARYFVASENIAWDIFRYDDYITPITANTQPVELAEHIVAVYGDFLRDEDYAGTIVALDLSATDNVATAVDNLAQTLMAEQSNAAVREQIGEAYVAAQKLDYDSNGEIEQNTEGYVDLYDLADRIRQTVTSVTIADAAQGVMDALDTSGFILAETHRSGLMWNQEGDPEEWDLEDVHGVSIYAPFGEELYVGLGCTVSTLDPCVVNYDLDCIKVRNYYTTTTPPQDPWLSLAQDTAWDEFVNSFIDVYYCGASMTASGLHLQGTEAQGLPPTRPVFVLTETREPNYDVDEWGSYKPPIGGVTIWRRDYSIPGLGRSHTVYLPPILRDR